MTQNQELMWDILNTPVPQPKSQLIRNNGKLYELWLRLAHTKGLLK
jgi:hypothetical protein